MPYSTANLAYQIKRVVKFFSPSWLVNAFLKQRNQRRLSFYDRSCVSTFKAALFPMGINLFGYIRGENGLGQSCRLLARALQNVGAPFSIYPLTQGILKNSETAWNDRFDRTAPFGINVIHVNPAQMPSMITRSYKPLLDNRYNIGFWLWEMENFPDEWAACFAWLDEIWTPSEFISRGIRKKTDLPVQSIPYGIEAPTNPAYDRKHFGLPEKAFLFLLAGDGRSVTDRKNPLGGIEAYCTAFEKDDTSIGLVLKLTQMSKDVMEKAHALLEGYPNIFWLNRTLPKVELNTLISCVDVFVSLHRAEGFGLVMAEAMLLGTPVIATNWSANTEFMDNTTACMVDYHIATLQQALPPYRAGDCWAEPDIAQAARYMRKLRDDPFFYAGLAGEAKRHIATQLSPARMGEAMKARINAIYAQHMRGPVSGNSINNIY